MLYNQVKLLYDFSDELLSSFLNLGLEGFPNTYKIFVIFDNGRRREVQVDFAFRPGR